MKWVFIIWVFLGVARNFAVANPECVGKIVSLSKNLHKLRPEVIASLEPLLQRQEHTADELLEILQVLKTESETVNNIYMNRSKLKIDLTQEQAEQIAEQFGWNISKIDEIQTLYHNTIKRYIIQTDEVLRGVYTDSLALEYGLNLTNSQRKLISVGLLLLNSGFTYPTNVLDTAEAMSLYSSYQFFDGPALERILAASQGESIDWEMLRQAELLPATARNWEERYEKPYSYYCCFETGRSRCTLCPYRAKP